MKRNMLLVVLMAFAVFAIPSHAGKPTPQTGQVEVVNSPENPVPVTTADQIDVNVITEPTVPRDVNVTNSSPIPVILTDGIGQKNIISGYVDSITGGGVITVPGDKQLILADIVIYFGGENTRIKVNEDGNIKLNMAYFYEQGGYTRSLHFNSGIPFASGSNVNIEGNGRVTISGYLIESP